MNKSLLLITLLSASLSSYADDGWKAFFEEVQLDKVSPINQTLKLPLTDLNGNALSENTIASGIIYSLLSNSQYPYNSSKQEKNVFFKGITAKYVPAEHTILVNYRNEKDYTSSMIIINGSGDVTYNVKDTIFRIEGESSTARIDRMYSSNRRATENRVEVQNSSTEPASISLCVTGLGFSGRFGRLMADSASSSSLPMAAAPSLKAQACKVCAIWAIS